jgi:hypothetical protein
MCGRCSRLVFDDRVPRYGAPNEGNRDMTRECQGGRPTRFGELAAMSLVWGTSQTSQASSSK